VDKKENERCWYLGLSLAIITWLWFYALLVLHLYCFYIQGQLFYCTLLIHIHSIITTRSDHVSLPSIFILFRNLHTCLRSAYYLCWLMYVCFSCWCCVLLISSRDMPKNLCFKVCLGYKISMLFSFTGSDTNFINAVESFKKEFYSLCFLSQNVLVC